MGGGHTGRTPGGVVWCGVTAVARPQPGEGHDVRTVLKGGIRQVQGSGRG